MGKLRIVPRSIEPGFMSFKVPDQSKSLVDNSSNIQLETSRGTLIRISREMPLRQVARLVKLLEQGGTNGLG